MRYTLFLLINLLSFIPRAIAQPEVSLSEPFEPMKWGWEKLLQMESGNTLYFHYAKGDMNVTIFDKQHKLVVKKDIDGTNFKAKKKASTVMNGLYEMNGEAVLFTAQDFDGGTTLFRLRFNPETGELVEEKILAQMFGQEMGGGIGGFGTLDPKSYFVEKDQNSASYAVICYNSVSSENTERIRVIQYSGDHKEVSNAFYGTPGNFKFVKPISTLLYDDNVYLAAYGYNTDKGNKDSRVIMSRLRKAETEFSHQLIEFTDDFKKTKGVMAYNPGTNKIQLLTSTFMQKVDNKDKTKKDVRQISYYVTLLTYIDPQTLDIITTKQLEYKKLREYAEKNFSFDYYVGLPQHMYINPDNSTTIVNEEIAVTGNLNQVGATGITDIDINGEETFGFAIAKEQSCFCHLEGYEKSARIKGAWKFTNTGMMSAYQDEYFSSFEYIRTKDNRYVLFNDDDRNFDKKVSEKPNAAYLVLSNAVVQTIGKDRDYSVIFGRPQTETDHSAAIVQSSHYLPSTKTNAFVVVDRRGKEKHQRIAWLTFK